MAALLSGGLTLLGAEASLVPVLLIIIGIGLLGSALRRTTAGRIDMS